MAVIRNPESIVATPAQGLHPASEAEKSGFIDEAILTTLNYYVRDPKHDHEKPYEIRYDTGGAIPDSNTEEESKPVLVHNFRQFQNPQSLQDYGFTSAKIDCPMKATDFDDKTKVEYVYYPAVHRTLREVYPDADEIKILEHGLRKRDPQFPIRDAYKAMQPSTVAHVDFTNLAADRTCRAAYKKMPDQYKRLLTVNVWKCLQGPGNDWPLALCDWRTLKRGSDSVALDIVYHNRFTETEGLYHNPEQQWYYLKDLSKDEIIIFQQTDSTLEEGGAILTLWSTGRYFIFLRRHKDKLDAICIPDGKLEWMIHGAKVASNSDSEGAKEMVMKDRDHLRMAAFGQCCSERTDSSITAPEQPERPALAKIYTSGRSGSIVADKCTRPSASQTSPGRQLPKLALDEFPKLRLDEESEGELGPLCISADAERGRDRGLLTLDISSNSHSQDPSSHASERSLLPQASQDLSVDHESLASRSTGCDNGVAVSHTH